VSGPAQDQKKAKNHKRATVQRTVPFCGGPKAKIALKETEGKGKMGEPKSFTKRKEMRKKQRNWRLVWGGKRKRRRSQQKKTSKGERVGEKCTETEKKNRQAGRYPGRIRPRGFSFPANKSGWRTGGKISDGRTPLGPESANWKKKEGCSNQYPFIKTEKGKKR